MIKTNLLPVFLETIQTENGVYLLSKPVSGFEDKYIRLRKKEGWLYSDEQVKQIPKPGNIPGYQKKIWNFRKQSAAKFVQYCADKKMSLKILEIGCGNGWFSHQIAASNPDFSVTGTDINFYELKQAARVFQKVNLHFVLADIFTSVFPENEFDIIVFNGSIQYFPELKTVFEKVKTFLNAAGEIHILDSPFYITDEGIKAAKNRTRIYYNEIEALEMAESYYHHKEENLIAAGAEFLYQREKKNLLARIIGIDPVPFPWLRIRK